MPVDPGSYRHGPPGQGRHRKLKPTERPLKRPVDEWLASGGWTAGWPGAGSVALGDDTGARSRVHNLWATEKRARGWTAGDVASRIVTGPDGSRRFYWWSVSGAGAREAAVADAGTTAVPDPLVVFVLARLGEDERGARVACESSHPPCGVYHPGGHVDPKVLARCAALRALAARAATAEPGGEREATLRHVAAIWSWHEGYRPEWAPDD